MKTYFYKLISILLYLFLLIFVLDFEPAILLDLKLIIIVCVGTAMLTAAGYEKNTGRSALLVLARQNAIITGYLTTFICLFARLTNNGSLDRLMYDVALNCRPLLYGLVLHALLKKPETPSIPLDKPSVKENNSIDCSCLLESFDLTAREKEIAIFVLNGLSNKEIAEKLFISEATVKKHVSNLYHKTNVSNREQLKQLLS